MGFRKMGGSVRERLPPPSSLKFALSAHRVHFSPSPINIEFPKSVFCPFLECLRTTSSAQYLTFASSVLVATGGGISDGGRFHTGSRSAAQGADVERLERREYVKKHVSHRPPMHINGNNWHCTPTAHMKDNPIHME